MPSAVTLRPGGLPRNLARRFPVASRHAVWTTAMSLLMGGLMLWGLTAPLAAQTRPAAEAPVGRLESQPLRTAAAPGSSDQDTSQVPDSSPFSITRAMLALGLVLSLILLLRWAGRRFFGPNISAGPTRVVQVLSRSVITPKQQVLLMQVGRRVLVVADNGTQMRTLAQLDDSDEVAELVGQLQQEKGESLVRTFGSLFRKQEQQYDPPVPLGGSLPAGATQRESAEPTEGSEAAVEASAESAGEMRQDLQGLMDKVKRLSRQFQR